ncbi:hypothetical protein, partial [Paracraurococcus ruber]|uniref:hypothetical protein n=1 Tax=Paracraurococcus ruber TaxID=77675 RepID=UPI00195FD522
DWLGGRGAVLLTGTRAVPAPGWVSAAHRALAAGADLALGTTVAPSGRRPTIAARHAALLAALDARLDPEGAGYATLPGQAMNAALRAEALAALGG